MDTLHQKYETLKNILREAGSVAVAFSSGVDSAFLLYTAHEVLKDHALAVTAVAPFFPKRERIEAGEFCAAHGIRQVIVKTDVLETEAFRHNPVNRCYLCKKEIFSGLIRVSKENGMQTVAEGSNMDDLGDYRPGLQAIKELGIRSPLREAGLYKKEIRALSEELGLPTWNKPSFACLASRFVYGETIDAEKLTMVEQAEELLLAKGFSQMRVRIHGTMARIELLPDDIPRMLDDDLRREIYDRLKAFGFSYVTLDLAGYRTGAMNETLTPHLPDRS